MGRRLLTVNRPAPGIEEFTFAGVHLGRVERVDLPTGGRYLWRARPPGGRPRLERSSRSAALAELVELAEEP